MSLEVRDIWDVGKGFSCTSSYVSVPSTRRNGWTIITAEDWILRPSVRKAVQLRVREALQRISERDDHNEIASPEIGYDPKECVNAVRGYLFGICLYETMVEDDRLPKQGPGGRIVYELESNVLRVYEVPSMAHDAAANALTFDFILWTRNNMLSPESFSVLGGGRK